MIKILFGVWNTISRRRKMHLMVLTGGMALAGFFEMLSLSTFAPLLAALASPRIAEEKILFMQIEDWSQYFNIEVTKSNKSQLMILAITFAFFATLAGGTRILVVWANARLTAALGTDITSKVYENCLNLSYSEHLNRGSGELVSLIRDKAGSVNTIIFYLLNLFSSILIALMICIGLFILHPTLTSLALALLGGFYILIGYACRNRLIKHSRVVAEQSTLAVKAVQEGLGSIRDVILDKSQAFYSNLFRQAEGRVQRASALGIFLSTAPRYFTDTFAMVAFALILVFWLRSADILSRETFSALPIFGVLALGAQRSMPLLQQIYTSWTVVSSNTASLKQVLHKTSWAKQPNLCVNTQALRFHKSVCLCKASFRYRENLPYVLRDLDLQILKGSCVGIRGETGCGKSTLVDIIMGLLAPTEGCLEVDDVKITFQNVAAWQKNIAHVPQNIFLADVSIAENIALGFDKARGRERDSDIWWSKTTNRYC